MPRPCTTGTHTGQPCCSHSGSCGEREGGIWKLGCRNLRGERADVLTHSLQKNPNPAELMAAVRVCLLGTPPGLLRQFLGQISCVGHRLQRPGLSGR